MFADSISRKQRPFPSTEPDGRIDLEASIGGKSPSAAALSEPHIHTLPGRRGWLVGQEPKTIIELYMEL